MPTSYEHQPGYGHPDVQGELLATPAEAKEATKTNEAKVLELLSLPPERTSELRAKLRQITERTLATTANPHDRESLMVAAAIVEWRLLAGPGSPLSFGLVQGRNKAGKFNILYDTTTGFGVKCIEAALSQLNRGGLIEIHNELDNLIQERSNKIAIIFNDMLESSQAFQFIHALAQGELPEQPEEQPLTHFWRAVREAQINQTVRSRWGLEPHEPIIPYTEPDYDLRRKLLKLDDETNPRAAKPENDPLAKLRAFLGALVQVEFSNRLPKETFAGFAFDSDGDMTIRTVEEPDRYYDPLGLIQAAAQKLALQINETGPHVQVITEEWLYFIIERVLWPPETPERFEETNDWAMEKAWGESSNGILGGRIFSADDYFINTEVCGIFHAGLVQPSGSYYNLSQLQDDISDKHNHYVTQQNRAEIHTLQDKKLGEVLRFTPSAQGRYAHRLIQSEPKMDDLPEPRGDEELIIRLLGEEFDYAQPYIPGYRLISSGYNVYGFKLDEAGDPYAPANIHLTPEQCHKLTACYTKIGLEQLARLIEHRPRLTVQELTSLISNGSTYVTEEKRMAMWPPLPYSIWTAKFDDFEELIRHGRLHIQCSGAAQFLRLSLETIFGKGMAATTEGYKLSRYTISTLQSHQQTVLTHQGHTYILDATPASTEGALYNDLLFKTPNAPPLSPTLPPATAKSIQLGLSNLQKIERKFEPVESREQKIQAIRRSLETQLIGLLQVSDRDAVYDKIVALTIEDPFRVTLETTLRASNGEAHRDEVERLERYLAAYQEANEILRQQMRVPSYDSHIIQVLQNTAQQLLAQF